MFGAASSFAMWSALSMISAVSFCQAAMSGRFPAHGRSTTSSPSSSRSSRSPIDVELVRPSAYDVLTFVFAVAHDLVVNAAAFSFHGSQWVFQWQPCPAGKKFAERAVGHAPRPSAKGGREQSRHSNRRKISLNTSALCAHKLREHSFTVEEDSSAQLQIAKAAVGHPVVYGADARL